MEFVYLRSEDFMIKNNFTLKARSIIEEAIHLAQSKSHQATEPEHILSVMLASTDTFCSSIISQAGGNIQYLKQHIQSSLQSFPVVSGDNVKLYMSENTLSLINTADQLGADIGDSYVSAEVLILAMVNVNAKIANIMKNAGITDEAVRATISSIRQGKTVQDTGAENNYQSLNKFTQNLTVAATEGKLDPVIGRDEEIRRTLQILCRRTKNNPVLIGEPGVGKTAIVEGIAQRIASGDVAETLRNKSLLSLDMGGLVAGAKFRGEFEERIKSILQEIQNNPDSVVLFIDEIHTLVGAGRTDGAMDASNLLKPALARGELRCIGATTLEEYRKYIEKDAALARRFQKVYIPEPSVCETISIIRGLKEKYELYHGVHISDNAIVAAAQLSDRYISDQFLPDKAIDLIDESASNMRMQIDSKPEELDRLDRDLMQKRIEIEALRNETDDDSIERLESLSQEISELSEQSEMLTQQWRDEKTRLINIQNIKEQLDSTRIELENVKRSGNLTKAGEITYLVIPTLEKQLADAENSASGSQMLEEIVTPEHIASCVARITGIPVDKMLKSEQDKLLNMENDLQKSIVGQSEAISSISAAVRRSRTGISDTNRPLGSFMFLGPTGVGKTELAKALAEFMFDSPDAALRFDMSEFMEKHSVSRLIGAPPGYVGYDKGGALSEAVRSRPYQLILLDEIEKAHPDVLNIFLQILDAGRLTDGQGHTVNFRNTILIMTSNLGAEIITHKADNEISDNVRSQVMDIVKNYFRPEFLNRLDDIIVFNMLSRNMMENIVNIQLCDLEKQLKINDISLSVDKNAREWLAEKGYDPFMGARPLKRVIQKYLADEVALFILSGKTTAKSCIYVSHEPQQHDKLTIITTSGIEDSTTTANT